MNVDEARQLLGTVAQNMTDTQVESLVANFTQLADTWLDDFEKKTFGKTIADLGTTTYGK